MNLDIGNSGMGTTDQGKVMRVALVCETFPPDMGYLVTGLPKYLVRLGLEVHVISLDRSSYSRGGEWGAQTPAFFLQQVLPRGSREAADGYTVHILGHGTIAGHAYALGLSALLAKLRPHVVYAIAAIGALPLQCALLKLRFGFRLFTGNHTSAEIFPLAKHPRPVWSAARISCWISRWIPGRLISLVSVKCYCRTPSCADVAQRFFGVESRKISVISLGVDTDYFYPASRDLHVAEREHTRRDLGLGQDEIVCIYTGRMIPSKNIALLVRAIGELRRAGLPYRGLFIGEGPERDVIVEDGSCIALDYRPFKELGKYYRAADIGVWAGSESTSIFDAAASGLPLILSQRVDVDMPMNAIVYQTGELDSLCRALRTLADMQTRRRMGDAGAKLVAEQVSWHCAAQIRAIDFAEALPSNPKSG